LLFFTLPLVYVDRADQLPRPVSPSWIERLEALKEITKPIQKLPESATGTTGTGPLTCGSFQLHIHPRLTKISYLFSQTGSLFCEWQVKKPSQFVAQFAEPVGCEGKPVWILPINENKDCSAIPNRQTGILLFQRVEEEALTFCERRLPGHLMGHAVTHLSLHLWAGSEWSRVSRGF
jgi:hypothetical protein